MKNQAFTLIELLVVVLIIGILAAIAVPQYQKAVDKADFTKYQSMAKSLVAAYDEYYLQNGEGTSDFKKLSFTLPNDFKKTYQDHSLAQCYSNESMFCCITTSGSEWAAVINCGKNDLSLMFSIILYGHNYTLNTRQGTCLAQADNSRVNRLCASLGQENGTSRRYTPQGLKSYIRYNLN